MAEKRELSVNVYPYSYTRELSFVADVVLVVWASIANHRWGGGSAWLDAFLAVLGFMTVLVLGAGAYRDRFSGTPDEAIEWLEKRKAEGDL